MVTKKFFALASITALTGLIAASIGSGCSSTTVEPATTGDATTGGDARGDTSKVQPPPDDGSTPPTDDTCKGKLAVDTTKLPWKSPNVSLGACTPKMLADLVTYVDANQTAKYADWKKTVTDTTCSACIFGKEADAKWKPLLEDAMGTLIELNVGGCIALASGLGATKGDACGKAYQNWFDCRFEACTDCPNGDSAAFQKCAGLASKAACKAAAADVGTVCGQTEVGNAETACQGDKFVFEGPIKAQCIAGTGDGGDN